MTSVTFDTKGENMNNEEKIELIENIIVAAEMLHDRWKITLYKPDGEIGAMVKYLQTTHYPDGTKEQEFLIYQGMNKPDKFIEREMFNIITYLIRACDYRILQKVPGCRNAFSVLKKIKLVEQALTFRNDFWQNYFYEALRK